MKTLEVYKRAFYIRIFGLICGGTILLVSGIIFIVMAVLEKLSDYGLILGVSFALIGIIFFALLPVIIRHGKKTIRKDEEELEKLKNIEIRNDSET